MKKLKSRENIYHSTKSRVLYTHMETNELFAKNLAKLRKDKGITQLELANVLNFTDRNISKWENGQSLPSIDILLILSSFFNVSIDDMLKKDLTIEKIKIEKNDSHRLKDHLIILGLSILCVFLIATIAFVATPTYWSASWLSFVFAVPASSIVAIVFIAIWFKKFPYLFIAISILVWSLLASIYLPILILTPHNYWFLFLIGVPLQVAVVLWSLFNHYHKK